MPETKVHAPAITSGVPREWLQNLGLDADPFARRDATTEDLLETYFVEPQGFDSICGPIHYVLCGQPGNGKTACRIMVERLCLPLDQHATTLSIPYYQQLAQLARQVDPDWRNKGRRAHQSAVVRSGWQALLNYLAQENAPSLPSDLFPVARGLLDAYAPELVQAHTVLPSLRQLGAIRSDYDLSAALQAFENPAQSLREALGISLKTDSKAGQILVGLVDTISFPPQDCLDSLVLIAQAVGIRQLFYVIDELDSVSAEGQRLGIEEQFDLLAPLLTDETILRHDQPPGTDSPGHVAFKLFLPQDVLGLARERCPEFTAAIPPQDISWTEDALLDMLSQRLRAFSKGEVESLEDLFESNVNAEGIDLKLIRWARGSPRLLLELGEELLRIHCKRPAPEPELQQQDIEALEQLYDGRYAPDLHPLLHVDEGAHRVLVGDIEKAVTASEFGLLAYLYQHAGKICSKKDIWNHVLNYEGASTKATIDSLVWRTRQKIEEDPKNPVYLKTVRRKGYRLLHTRGE